MLLDTNSLPSTPFNYKGGVIYSDVVNGRWRIYLTKGDRICKTINWGPSQEAKHDSWQRAANLLDIHNKDKKRKVT